MVRGSRFTQECRSSFTRRPAPCSYGLGPDRCVGRYYQAAERRIYAWTQGVITSAGYYDWLSELFLEKRTTLPDGTTILGVHAPPGRDDGSGFSPAATEMELQQLF
mgnify:CR=1 FL=1|jgi:hypothetical protein